MGKTSYLCIQILKYEKTHVFICFPNFPFVTLEEYGINLFTDLEKAEERLKQIRERKKIEKLQEIMEKNKKNTWQNNLSMLV